MYDLLKGRTYARKEDVTTFIQEMIRIPSESLKEESLSKLIETKMKTCGFDDVIKDDYGNVLGTLIGRKHRPTILLTSHMDTVAVTNKKDWTYGPFEGKIVDERIHGVGASDCKAGLGAQIFAGSILKDSLLPLDGNLVIAASVAEENGISLGIESLITDTLKKLDLFPDYVILGEPTNLGLYYGHDGWVELDILVNGNNLFDVEDTASDIFQNFSADINLQHQSEELHIGKPSFSGKRGQHQAVINLSRRVHLQETGVQIASQIKNQVQKLAAHHGEVSVVVDVHQEKQKLYTGTTTVVKKTTNAWEIDPFCSLMERSRQALTAAGINVKPGKWKLDHLGMGTAGNTLVNKLHIPTIGYGPGEEEMAHQVNESVAIENVMQTIYGTISIVHSLIGIPVFGWTADDI